MLHLGSQIRSLSLRTKGLVAVSLPVVVVLLFVALSAREGRSNSRRAAEAVRSDLAVRASLRALEAAVSSADAEVLTLAATGAAEARPDFDRHMRSARAALRRFDE